MHDQPVEAEAKTVLNIPDANLAYLDDGKCVAIPARRFFAGRKIFAIGVPGAYTPVCNSRHVPDLVREADHLRTLGFDQIVCIASNDPFVLNHWAGEIDPEHKIDFLADGNNEFASALCVVQNEMESFLGLRSARYAMSVDNNIIKRLVVERSMFDLSCTDPSNAQELDNASEIRELAYI